MVSARILPQLPEALEDTIIGLLPQNEVACTVRIINKSSSLMYSGPQHTTVRLSQPVPHHAFAAQWDQSAGIWRTMTYKKRIRFLCITASTGDLTNLDVAVKATGCVLTDEVLQAGAEAGHLHVCQWLLEREGRVWGMDSIHGAVWAALRSSHLDVAFSLLQRLPSKEDEDNLSLLRIATEGCDLPTLQRLHRDVWPVRMGDLSQSAKESMLSCAAASPTPDWRAKVEWLEAAMGGLDRHPCISASTLSRPDAVERLQWLRQRGYPLNGFMLASAANHGNLPALQYLLDEAGEGAVASFGYNFSFMFREGHLAALQLLVARGFACEQNDLADAALGGNRAMVRWIMERMRIAPRQLSGKVLVCAAYSGDADLLEWLHAGGCRWSKKAFVQAAAGGCAAAMEWLLEQGCPMPDDGEPYFKAAKQGDLATLDCLKYRLGCPMGTAKVFNQCVRYGAPLAALRWLDDAAWPMEPAEASALAKEDWRGHDEAERDAAVAWLGGLMEGLCTVVDTWADDGGRERGQIAG